MALNLLTANDRPGEYPGSYYAASADQLTPFKAAAGEMRADVCVIGGGFTGLSAALHLAKAGYDVVLLEAQRVGFGASGRNGGQVGMGQRLEQDELETMVGVPLARDLWDLACESVAVTRELAEAGGVRFHEGIIHADHKPGFVPEHHEYVDKLRDEYGHDKIRSLSKDEMREVVGSPAYHGGSIDMQAGHLHPLNYALALARACVEAGVRIHERSTVSEVLEGTPATVKTDKAQLTADYVLYACNGYLGRLQGKVAARMMPINNFIVATEPLSPEAQEGLIKGNHAVADSKFVVNYFRFSDDGRLLFGGAESYGYRFPKDIRALVSKPMLEIYPQLHGIRLDYAWGGTLGITMNRMPHFARLSGNVLSASGYSGHGVAMATLGGKLMAEAVQGQAERFDFMADVPTPRFPGGAALRSPLLVLAMLWYSLRDKL